eukprot:g13442.t1
MPVPGNVSTLYKEFDNAYKKTDHQATDALLNKLKLELAKLGNQLLLQNQDEKVKQLKVYYRDFKIPTKSANEYKILGLYLLYLVCSDRISEFHTELELVPQHDSQFIQRPVLLERYLMEGNFAKINQSCAEFSTQEHYPVFLEQLQDTMRRRILESLAKSTSEVSLDRVAKMLYMKSVTEVSAYLKQIQDEKSMVDTDEDRGQEWEVVGNKLRLKLMSHERIAVLETLGNVIDYATEIERIV